MELVQNVSISVKLVIMNLDVLNVLKMPSELTPHIVIVPMAISL